MFSVVVVCPTLLHVFTLQVDSHAETLLIQMLQGSISAAGWNDCYLLCMRMQPLMLQMQRTHARFLEPPPTNLARLKLVCVSEAGPGLVAPGPPITQHQTVPGSRTSRPGHLLSQASIHHSGLCICSGLSSFLFFCPRCSSQKMACFDGRD